MLSDDDRRTLLEQVIGNTVAEEIQVDWLESPGWSAHARLEGSDGLVGYLLTSPEWQEARFAVPHRSTFLITASDDGDDVRQALERLARVVVAYLSNDYEIESRRGIFGVRTTLAIHAADGTWRIGRRMSQPPPRSP
ncbi:hypothetical protein [Aeromicrobium terrae]|uniref:Uncharacterized protein n=1 Tax=Aeromicrobium terrae TaxID=2498846 RepID=A0A5C8NGV6_9ACTN|nr:hypothetical protein [Aeromicrobium terrae]TXL57574.1 hypothetical protein FHP06_12330 [Aeromicrobium terrae]